MRWKMGPNPSCPAAPSAAMGWVRVQDVVAHAEAPAQLTDAQQRRASGVSMPALYSR